MYPSHITVFIDTFRFRIITILVEYLHYFYVILTQFLKSMMNKKMFKLIN